MGYITYECWFDFQHRHWTHMASYSLGTTESFPSIKLLGSKVDNDSTLGATVMNTAIPSLPMSP
jgi:hypothetical protein